MPVDPNRKDSPVSADGSGVPDAPQPNQPGRRTRVANAALILGIVSLPLLVVWPMCIGVARLAPVVVGCAAVAVGGYGAVQALRRPARYAGKWRALLGAALGLFSAIAFWPFVSSFLYWQIAPVCESNLQLVGQALEAYYHDESAFPARLTVLQDVGFTTGRELHCPLSGSDPMDGRSDYVYVAGLSPTDSKGWIVAYDKTTNHERGDGYVLYLSGEVKHLSRREFEQEIARFQHEYETAKGQPPTLVE